MSDAPIVVGIDGSEGSRRALQWALEEGSRRGCAVEAVTAWPSRDVRGELSAEQTDESRRRADETLRHLVEGALREFDTPPAVSFEVVHGDAVETLLRMSSSASLLVVGSHGTSSIMHATLGSVSDACGRLAECPVVVVPRRPTTSRGGVPVKAPAS